MARRKLTALPDDVTSEEAEIAAWTKSTRLEVLACRQFGHAWVRGLSDIYRLNRWHWARELGCTRCGMLRIDIIPANEYGVYRRRYLPPPDYSRERGIDGSVRVPRRFVNEALISRARVLEAPAHVREFYEANRPD